MDKKNKHFVNSKSKEGGVTESAAKENKSDSGDSATDDQEYVSVSESTEVVESTPGVEVTTVQSSTPKHELTEVIEMVSKDEELEAVESSFFKSKEHDIESTRMDTQVKYDESKSVTRKEVYPISSGDVPGSCSPKHPSSRNISSKVVKSSDEFPEPPVIPQGHAEELPVAQVTDEAERSTDSQGQDAGNVKTEEQQGPLAKLPGIQIKKVDDSNGSQNTKYINTEQLEPPLVFRDDVGEVPVTQVKETAKGSSDSERKECQDTEEGDEDGSSQETYCSESSFQRTECTAHKNIHIVLESDSEHHQQSEGTGSLGGASQATTVDIADLEVMPCSEADMFASQNEEDAEVSGVSSGTVPDYGDFVKGSHDGSKTLMQSSTIFSVDGSQDSSSTAQTSLTKSVRKRKHDESVSSHPPSKLQRIVEDDGGDFNVEKAKYPKERSSLGVDVLPPSPIHSCSPDNVTRCKTTLKAVSLTKVMLKEKVVVLGQKANGQRPSGSASPKANRKLIFGTEAEGQKPQFVLSYSDSEGNAEKVQTDHYKEEGGQDGTPSVQHSNGCSPEIEMLNCENLRQSIEVVYVSSHSCDSTKSSSQHGTSAGRKRLSANTVDVTDIESNADTKKDADTDTECSDESLVLHLSSSQSQKSVYLTPASDKNDSCHSPSLNADLTNCSYTSSNADTLNSESRSDQETFDGTKQNVEHVSGSFNSEGHSVHTVHTKEIHEKPSQIQSSGSGADTGQTDGSDSFTTVSKVKGVVQITSVESSQCVAPVDSEGQLRLSKTKSSDVNQGTVVVSTDISDSESDGHSTPSEVQKNVKMETAHMTTGREDTPSSLLQKVLTFRQKGTLGLHSTPQTDHATPPKQHSASSIEQDSVQETDTEWEVILKVKVKQLKQSGKDICRVQQCEDITEDIARLTARILCDSSSSGGLADTSSKSTTPSSTASGGGPFPLPPNRLSLISTTSGSSTSSGGSSVIQGVTRQRYATGGGPFLIPNYPGLKISRDRSFRSEEVICGIQPGICGPIVDGCEIMHKVILSSCPESSDRYQGRNTRSDTGDSGKKSDIQKPRNGSILHDDLVMKKTGAVSSSLAHSDAIPVPADVLKETPKSTVKPLKRRRSRSSVKKRSLPQSCSKQIVKRERRQLSPVEDKTPVICTSVQDVVTLTVESEVNNGSDTVTWNSLRTPEVSSALPDCSYLKLGSPVFARWTDKKYYSGRIQERCKDGHWQVIFDDTRVKPLVEDFMIAVDELPEGQLVYAFTERGDYESGVIVNVEKKCNDIKYTVELDDNSFVTVSRSLLCMTEDQANLLREMVATSVPAKNLNRADISLDNVLLGKRSRNGSRDVENKLDSPGVSGMSKTSPWRKVFTSSITESDTSSTVEDVDGVEQESHEIKLGKVKGLDRRTPRKNVGNLLGPVPPVGSKIFAGKVFLLTSSDVKHACTRRTDAEETDYDSECQCTACSITQNILFSRSHLTEQIKAGSGKLYDKFEDVPPSKYDSCYLISDRPNQTAKFILCLAYGIQLVSHAWIIECCETNVCQPLPKYYLAAGWSLENRGFVRNPNKRPLFHVNIGLLSDTKHFLKFWELVLKGAGACVFDISRDPCVKELECLDVVVCNYSCPTNIQKQLEQQGTPLVSTTWIVQCLINGSKLPTHNTAAI